MMICPETFYEMRLKGKTTKQIMTVIRGLKQEKTRLKNIIEHPNYRLKQLVISPSEEVRFYMTCDYLERAKQALIEAGGVYIPSATEKKVIDFDDSIPYIKELKLSIGGFFEGYETKTFTVMGDKIHTTIEHSKDFKTSNSEDSKIELMGKDEFLESFHNLHIGEWRKKYDNSRFHIAVKGDIHWCLEIHFSNGRKSVKISGDNAYPYNFNRLLELFEMENEGYSI